MQPQDAKPTVAPLDGRGAPAGAMAAPTGGRRDEIVDAARSLYEEKGLSRTTIQDITARLGVTRSLFYHYFPNKDAVTSAVLDTYVADFVEAVHYWDRERKVGQIDDALASVVRLLRLGLFEDGSFRHALASDEELERAGLDVPRRWSVRRPARAAAPAPAHASEPARDVLCAGAGVGGLPAPPSRRR